MIKAPKKTVSVLMQLELYEWVAEQAVKTDRTIPGYIRQVLKRYRWHMDHVPETLTGEWEIT